MPWSLSLLAVLVSLFDDAMKLPDIGDVGGVCCQKLGAALLSAPAVVIILIHTSASKLSVSGGVMGALCSLAPELLLA